MSQPVPGGVGSFSLGHTVPPLIHLRRQQSLELILNLEHCPLDAPERVRAERIFSGILTASAQTASTPSSFDHICLLRLSLEQNPSESGKDNFLNYVLRNYDDTESDPEPAPFLQVLDRLDQNIPQWMSSPPPWVVELTMSLANYLVHNFFLPLKGRASKTPQLTPHLIPAGDSGHVPTPNRLSNLRATCLARDSHRCLVSGFFDRTTAYGRVPAIDDSGLALEPGKTIVTEVAHIIPHALAETANETSPLDPPKAKFWDIMRLFHPYAERLLDGTGIDKPCNAMTLAVDLHQSFGSLQWYFEEEPEPHAYLFKESPRATLYLFEALLPQNPRRRVEFVGTNMTDLPDRGLLALHRACAIILGLSGAGEYVDKVLRDEEDLRQGGGEKLEQGVPDLAAMSADLNKTLIGRQRSTIHGFILRALNSRGPGSTSLTSIHRRLLARPLDKPGGTLDCPNFQRTKSVVNGLRDEPIEFLTPLSQFVRRVCAAICPQRMNLYLVVERLGERLRESTDKAKRRCNDNQAHDASTVRTTMHLLDDKSFTKSKLYHWIIKSCHEICSIADTSIRFVRKFENGHLCRLRQNAHPYEKAGLDYWTVSMRAETAELETPRADVNGLREQVRELLYGASALLESRTALFQGERIRMLTYLAIAYLPMTTAAVSQTYATLLHIVNASPLRVLTQDAWLRPSQVTLQYAGPPSPSLASVFLHHASGPHTGHHRPSAGLSPYLRSVGARSAALNGAYDA
ncbi:hypothetical protein FGG08_004138 [Glutinoglossum americanum]|uniref:HNH nuclease domain-containing protein n=1 Tax=Glutinoglossum americanum TaxID=1670608 RepID=A0A9P8L304_9PEZI|nr:hypothetical protein FGG08_004138 [Glutinoglossum americanum]